MAIPMSSAVPALPALADHVTLICLQNVLFMCLFLVISYVVLMFSHKAFPSPFLFVVLVSLALVQVFSSVLFCSVSLEQPFFFPFFLEKLSFQTFLSLSTSHCIASALALSKCVEFAVSPLTHLAALKEALVRCTSWLPSPNDTEMDRLIWHSLSLLAPHHGRFWLCLMRILRY